MDCEEEYVKMEAQEQIMIMMDGLYEPQDDADLLDLLGSVPKTLKKISLTYDYQPALVPISHMDIEENDEGGLKTSNRSTSTCPDSESPLRKCTCAKTRCQKNYCECFKLGESCSASCECKDCGNKEKLFLSKPVAVKVKCGCLKSHCLKKYCECHSSGMKCGSDCKCLQCENIGEISQQLQNMGSYFDHHLFFDI